MRTMRNIHFDAEDFHLQSPAKDIVNLSFGPTTVSMTLDTALDFQYQLAAFLAKIEMNQLPEAEDLETNFRMYDA